MHGYCAAVASCMGPRCRDSHSGCVGAATHSGARAICLNTSRQSGISANSFLATPSIPLSQQDQLTSVHASVSQVCHDEPSPRSWECEFLRDSDGDRLRALAAPKPFVHQDRPISRRLDFQLSAVPAIAVRVAHVHGV
eukprot:4524080-Prymnesium_polylepis.1